jgi:hypothetical protein
VEGSELERTVGPERDFDVAYALSPFEARAVRVDDEARARVPLQLSFANDEGWAADSDVDVLVLGSYLYTDYVSPARFEKVAGARVSPDARRIDMLPGQGVELLTWVGLRLAP